MSPFPLCPSLSLLVIFLPHDHRQRRIAGTRLGSRINGLELPSLETICPRWRHRHPAGGAYPAQRTKAYGAKDGWWESTDDDERRKIQASNLEKDKGGAVT
jgi:hypothetical protein